MAILLGNINQRSSVMVNISNTATFQHKPSQLITVGDTFLIERSTLASKLHQPTAMTDIALITIAYLKWGDNCVQHLQGNFTFAIWDNKKKTLICCYRS